MGTIVIGGFTPREQALADQIAELEEIVAPGDWFVRSIIEALRSELLGMVSGRIVADRDRFLKWKHSWRLVVDVNGTELLQQLRRHAAREYVREREG